MWDRKHAYDNPRVRSDEMPLLSGTEEEVEVSPEELFIVLLSDFLERHSLVSAG